MSEYDQRQYQLMLYKLTCVEDGDFSKSLVTDLVNLVGFLETRDPAWESAFQNGLADLDGDIFFATHKLDEGGDPVWNEEPSFDEERTERLRATAAELKQLVLQKIEAPADDAESLE